MVFLGFHEQARTVAADDARRQGCARLKMPRKRREEPRPPNGVSVVKRFKLFHVAARGMGFQFDLAGFDQIQPVRWLSLAEDDFARPELQHRGAGEEPLNVLRAQVTDEGMLFFNSLG